MAVQSLFPLHWLFLSRSAPPVLGSRSLPLGFLAFVLDWQAFALSVIASFLAAKVRTFFLGALLIFLARDPANLIMMVGRTDRSAQNAYVGPSPKRWKSSCGAAGDATADRGKCVEEYGLCSGGLQGCGQGIKSVLRELYERQQIAKERRLRA